MFSSRDMPRALCHLADVVLRCDARRSIAKPLACERVRQTWHERHASEQTKCPGDEDGLNESVGGEVFR